MRFSSRWSKIIFLNHTPEFIYCRASKPQIHRWRHCLYVPCLLKGFEVTDSLYRLGDLITALDQLVNASTGLERILTTPIPYSSVLLCSRNRRILIATCQIFDSSVDHNRCLLLHFGRPTWKCQPGLFTDMRTQPFQLWSALGIWLFLAPLVRYVRSWKGVAFGDGLMILFRAIFSSASCLPARKLKVGGMFSASCSTFWPPYPPPTVDPFGTSPLTWIVIWAERKLYVHRR